MKVHTVMIFSIPVYEDYFIVTCNYFFWMIFITLKNAVKPFKKLTINNFIDMYKYCFVLHHLSLN